MPKIFGYAYVVVVSGSMEPEFGVNDILYIKEQDSYEIGDIVTYEKYGEYITHRIVDINEEGDFILRGDSNNTDDTDPVLPEQIRGEVQYVLPGLGSFVLKLKTPVGTLIALLAALLCLELPYRIRRAMARKKGRKSAEQLAERMDEIAQDIKTLEQLQPGDEAALDTIATKTDEELEEERKLLTVEEKPFDPFDMTLPFAIGPKISNSDMLQEMIETPLERAEREAAEAVRHEHADFEFADADYDEETRRRIAEIEAELYGTPMSVSAEVGEINDAEAAYDNVVANTRFADDMTEDVDDAVLEEVTMEPPPPPPPPTMEELNAQAAMFAERAFVWLQMQNEAAAQKEAEEAAKAEKEQNSDNAEFETVPIIEEPQAFVLEPKLQKKIDREETNVRPVDPVYNAEDYDEETRIRIAEIEAELYGVSANETLETVDEPTYAEQIVETSTYEEVCVETVYEEAVEEYDEETLRRIAEIEAELGGSLHTDSEESIESAEDEYYYEDEEAVRRRIAEIESELYGIPFEELYQPLTVSYSKTSENIDEFENDQTLESVDLSEHNENDYATEYIEQDYAAQESEYESFEYDIDTLRRIAQIEAELAGVPYVDPFPDTENEDAVVEDAVVEETIQENITETVEVETETEEVETETEEVEAETEEVEAETDNNEDLSEVKEAFDADIPVENKTIELSYSAVAYDDETRKRIAEIESQLYGIPFEQAYTPSPEEAVAPRREIVLTDQERIAEIEKELAGLSRYSSKKYAEKLSKAERKHKRAVEKHRRNGPKVYVPDEGVWDVSVDEYSLEDILKDL